MLLYSSNPRNSAVRLFQSHAAVSRWNASARNLDCCLWLPDISDRTSFSGLFRHSRNIFAVGHKCAELQESRCRDSRGRRITRSLFTCRGIIVPVRNQVVRLYTFHNHVCNVNGFLQESRVPGFAIAGSVAVYSPRLAARPGRFCIFTLVCLFDFHASVIVIADHVIGGVVRTEVVFIVVCACFTATFLYFSSPVSLYTLNSRSRFIILSMITGKFHAPKSHERIQPISGLKRAHRLSAVSTSTALMVSLGARRRALP